jgi:hypothetical protein
VGEKCDKGTTSIYTGVALWHENNGSEICSTHATGSVL